MITHNDLQTVDIFAELDRQCREFFAAKAADLHLSPQEWLLQEGEPSGFYVLLEGTVEMWKELNGKQQRLHTRGPLSYFGELPILLGTTSAVSIRAGEEPCRLAGFDRQQLQELIRDYPSFSRAISQTLTDRVTMAQNYARAMPSARVILRGDQSDSLCHSLRSFLFANHVQYDWCPSANHKRAEAITSPPEIVVDGEKLAQPTTLRKLAESLGLQTAPIAMSYDVVIIGAGPAGMAAAVYGASEGLATLMVEKFAVGGQAGTSSRIENYLGFPGGVSGDDLSRRAFKQAQRFGAEIAVTREVVDVRKQGDLFQITLDGHEAVTSNTVLLASGVEWRVLHARGIKELLGRGVFYGSSRTEALSLRGKCVYLVGGGNSAGQAAMFLAAYAAEVHILVRSTGLAASMSQYLINQLKVKNNIVVHPHTVVESVEGGQWLESITTCRSDEHGDQQRMDHAADALFIMIGASARTSWLPNSIERDSHGYIYTGQQISQWHLRRPAFALESSLPGLFCAGDVRFGSIKRVASSVGEGSMTISIVHQYLGQMEKS